MINSTHTSRSSRGGLLSKLLLLLGVVFAVVVLAWIFFLPTIVSSVVQSKTGFALKVDSLSVNPFTAKVQISGLVLQNPSNWPERAFVDLREFRADADLLPLLKGKLLADEVVVNVARVTVVKNRDGAFNAIVLKEALAGPAEPTPPGQPAPDVKAEFLIRRLHVKVGQLVYADHSGAKPAVKEYNLAIDRELRDVASLTDIIQPFQGVAFKVMADVLGGAFQGATQMLQNSGEVLKDAGGALKDTGKKAGDAVKGLFQSLDKKKP